MGSLPSARRRGTIDGVKKRPILLPVACALLVFSSLLATHAASLDANQIESISGLQGTWSAAEGVFKVSQPHNDVTVKVDEWKMPPFTSW